MKKKKSKPKAKRKRKRKGSAGTTGSQNAPNPESPASDLPPESRLSVASTVAWLLCSLATLLALIATVITLVVHQFQPSETNSLLGSVFVFIGLITGILTLILTYFCQRVRDFPSPRGVTFGTTLIGSLAVMLWLADQVFTRS
ncbi:MAG: hypothetical protein AAF497_27350 [Planctomycetota bacterium]